MLVNGEFGNLISIRDRGLLYGDGVFRTLRVSSGKPEHWPLHYQKLQHDCTALGIACPDFACLSEEMGRLLPDYPDAVYLQADRHARTGGARLCISDIHKIQDSVHFDNRKMLSILPRGTRLCAFHGRVDLRSEFDNHLKRQPLRRASRLTFAAILTLLLTTKGVPPALPGRQ